MQNYILHFWGLVQFYSISLLFASILCRIVDDIEINYRLSVLKPLHAKWLISFYNYMTTTKGQEVISNGWKRSGIYDSITLGSSKLPALDPFSDICPLMEVAPPMETLSLASLFPKELDLYRWRVDDVSDDESEWECDDDTTFQCRWRWRTQRTWFIWFIWVVIL